MSQRVRLFVCVSVCIVNSDTVTREHVTHVKPISSIKDEQDGPTADILSLSQGDSRMLRMLPPPDPSMSLSWIV